MSAPVYQQVLGSSPFTQHLSSEARNAIHPVLPHRPVQYLNCPNFPRNWMNPPVQCASQVSASPPINYMNLPQIVSADLDSFPNQQSLMAIFAMLT
jgi:hypothetical protein